MEIKKVDSGKLFKVLLDATTDNIARCIVQELLDRNNLLEKEMRERKELLRTKGTVVEAHLRQELRKALENIPTSEFGEALRNGCDANGAWDCFRDVLKEHKEAVLEATGA